MQDGATVAGLPRNWILAGQTMQTSSWRLGRRTGLRTAMCTRSALKQIKARSNNGDFETRWLRAVAELVEAERVFSVGTIASALPYSLHTLREKIGACIARIAGEELPQLITDEKFSTFASSTGFVCYTNSITMVLDPDKYVERLRRAETLLVVHQSRDSSDGWANGARGIQLGCTGAVSGC